MPAHDLVEVCDQRRAVLGPSHHSRKIGIGEQILGTGCLAEAAPKIVARGGDVDVAVGSLEHAGARRGRVEIAFLAGDLALHQIACRLEIEHVDLRFQQRGMDPLTLAGALAI